jgi:hypothetical protein
MKHGGKVNNSVLGVYHIFLFQLCYVQSVLCLINAMATYS